MDPTPLEPTNKSELHQSICMLPRQYGWSLIPRLMAQSPIYAMAEIFAFLSAAESQYLDMVQSVLDSNTCSTAQIGSDQSDWRTILVFAYRGLDRHHHQASTTLAFVRYQKQLLDGPTNEAQDVEIRALVANLCLDFEYIITAVDKLKERCEHEVNLIMSGAAVEDALWSRMQSRNNLKFTVLATFYVPLAFSNSIFGMNFVEPQGLRQGFMFWAIVTFPVLMISLSFLIWDVRHVKRWRKKLDFGGAVAKFRGSAADTGTV